MAFKSLLLLALVAAAFAGPLSYPSQSCAETCEGRRHAYEIGKTYDYDLTTTVLTTLPGATEDLSSLKLTALAHVEAVSECDLALRLDDVLMQEAEANIDRIQDLKRGLEENTLRFALDGGKVVEVCPEEAEPTWALNIKRAVLSSLQNTMDDYQSPDIKTETDVVGECPVTYEPTGSTWSSYTISKIKDLLACSQPMYSNTVFQAMNYKVPSKVQSLPLLKSTHECQQEVTTNGRLTKSYCEERHIFRPFSREESGATTIVTHILVFKAESSGVRSARSVTRRTDLMFEHIPDQEVQDGTQREVMSTLQQICDVTKEGIRPEVPGLFGDLVKGMRRLDLDTLTSIGRRSARLCDKAQSFYRDAVPTLGTSAAVGLMRDMIKEGQASENEVDMWLTSLAFIPKPDVDMLKEVKPLLDIPTIRRKSYLAVSTMVNSYCRQNSGCDNDNAVRDIISLFQGKLGTDCSGDREPVLMALKALGNTGHASQVINTLNSCMANEAASMEVRVAAINAMRRMDCNADTTALLDILRNAYSDSELRINAYLALIRCPSERTLTIVKRLLESEEINQVGSFIWTHLTNLKETSSPLKQEIKAILENEQLKREFDLDKRKFSRNVEWSAFNDAINTGAALESNLIWSTQSFVPRSAMVNLTVDLFGHSVNLVELGGRIQGLDAILEKMFSDSPEAGDITDNKINNFDSSFRPEKTDPHGSYYIRVFGNEIRYEDFVGFDTQSIKDKLNYLQWLIELAKEHDFDFTKSMLFLESELKVPTVAGLPLVLSVDGTATMDLKIKGKIDLRDLASSPRGLDITGTVRPTAAIQVNGKMGVDAFVASTGLKMTNTFYTSTLADGSITLKDGKIFNLDINLPYDRMEVFNAQSKFFITYRGAEHEQAMPSEGRLEAHHCVADTMVSALGVEVCADLSLPRLTKLNGPWFPLTGPVSASISLNKRDSLSKYHMEARVIREEVSNGVSNHELVFSFNTPGSRYDREFTANFALYNAEKAVRLDLRTPWKKIDITGSLVNSDELKRIQGDITIDDADKYSMVSQLEIAGGRYATRYNPLIEVSMPGKALSKLHGSVIYREGKKADVDITIDNVFDEPATFKGLVRKIAKNEQMRLETDMAIDVMSFKGKMSGFVDSTYSKDEVKADTELTIRYRTSRGPQSVSLTNQFQMQTPRGRNSIVMNGAVATSLYKRWDSDYSLQLFSEAKEAGLSLNMGLAKDKPTRITLDLQGKHDITRNYRNALVQGLARVTFPGDEWETKFEHMHNHNELKTTWMGRENRDEANLEVSLKHQDTDPLNVAAKAKLTYPGREMSYVHTLTQINNVFNHDLNVNVDSSDKFTLNSVYKMGRRHEMSADITFDGSSPIHVEGFVQPDLRDFATEAKLSHRYNSYSTNLEWQHTGNYRNFNNKANWKMSFNGDKVGLDSDVSIDNYINLKYDVQGNWNINNQGLRKAGISGTATASRTTPSVLANVQWSPNNFVSGEIDLKLDENNFWSRTRNLEGTLKFRSTYFDDINAAFKHERRPETVSMSGEVEWAPRKKIDGSFSLRKLNGWSNANVNVALNTPFSNARRINTEATYNLGGQRLTANGKAEWDNQIITFDTSSIIDLPNVDISVTGTTPFNGYETYSLTAKQTSAGRNCQTEVKLQAGSRQLVAIDYNMEHQRTGYMIDNSGSLSVNLPIEGYTTNKLTWNHRNTLRDIDSRIVLELENEKSILDFEAKNRRQFMIKANVISPYIPNIRLKLDHSKERRQYIYKSAGSLQYGRDRYNFDNDLSLLETSFTLKTKVTTPIRNWEEMNLDLSNVIEGNVFRASNKFVCGSGHTYELSGTFINNGMPAFSTEMKLAYHQYGEVLIDAANAKQMNIWVTGLNVAYPESKRINVVTKLGLEELKKISVDIVSPYEAMREASMDIEFRGKSEKCDTKFKFAHNNIRGSIEGEMNIDVSDVNDIKIKLTGSTPFEGMTSVRSIVSHKKTSQVYQTDFGFEIPVNKFTASNMVRITNNKVFNTLTSVEYTTGKKIELELDVNVQRNVAIRTAFKSPWTGVQTANLNHQGSWNNFETILNISPRQYETIDSRVEFKLQDSNINAMAKIMSTYSELRILEVTLNHRGEVTAFNNEFMVNYNGKKMTGNSQFDLDERGIRGQASLNTPFENYRTMSFVFEHNGDLTVFNSKYVVNCEDKKIELIMDYNYNYRGVTGRFELTTPFEQVKTAILNFEQNGNLKDFRNNGNLRYNNKEFSGESSFQLSGKTLKGSAKVRTPDEYNLEMNHDGDWRDFKNDGKLYFNNQQYSGESSFRLTGNSLKASAQAKTPEEYSIEVNHNGDWRDFRNNANLHLNGKQYSGESSFELRRDGLKGTAVARTPEEYSIEVNHNGDRTNFRNNVNLNLNGKQYSGQSTFELTRDGLKGTANVRAPEEYSIEVNHNGGWRDFTNNANLHLNGKQYSGESSFELTRDGLKGTAVAKTPEEYSIEFNHNGDRTNFRNNVDLRLNGKQYSGESSFQLTRDGLKGTAVVRIPEVYSIEINHNGDIMDFNNNAIMRLNGQAFSGQSSFKMVGTSIEMNIMAETPYRGFSNMGVTFTHRGGWSDFECDLTLKLEDQRITGRHVLKNPEGTLEHTITIQTPFEGFSTLEYRLNGQSNRNSFNTEITLSKEQDRIEIRDNFRATRNKISNSFSISTPFSVLREASLTFYHNGNRMNFNNELTASWNRKSVTGKTTFSLNDYNMETTASIETPFEGYSRAAAELKHTGPITNFNNELILSLNNKVIKSTNSFNLKDDKVIADFKTETPFVDARLMRFQLTHSDRSTGFNNEVTLTLNSDEIKNKNSFVFRPNNRIDGEFSIETPFRGYRKLSATMQHNGESTDFNCEYSLSLEDKKITLRNNFLLQGAKLECSAILETPFTGYNTMGFSLKHNGYATDFNNELSANIERSTIRGDSSFKLSGSKVDLSVALTTPFRVLRSITVTVDHDGPLTNFRNEGVLHYNGERYTANTEFAIRRDNLKLAASVRIPDVYGFSFDHQGPWTGFNNNLIITIAGNPHTATSSFTYDDKVEGNFNLDTPRFPVTMRFNHEGVRSNFKQDSSLDIAGKTYRHTGVFKVVGRKLNSNFNIETPHEIARSLSLRFDHQGKWNNFENKLVLEKNGDEFEVGAQLAATEKRVKGDITIKTPKEYSISIIQKGPADDMTAIVKLTLKNQKSQANIDFKNKNNVVEGGISIRTPYRGYKNMGAEFSFKNKKVLTITGKVKTPLDSFEAFAFEITHRGDTREFTTSGKVETPFHRASVITFEMNHEGRSRNFVERAFIDVDQQRISGNVAFRNNNAGLQTSATIETPFEMLKTASASLTHNGELADFTTTFNGEYNNQKLEASTTFKKADNIQATATLTTPFEAVREAKININHEGNSNEFVTSSDMSVNGQEIRGNFNFNKLGTVVESRGSISTPFNQMRQGSFRLNHRGTYRDFVTSGEVEFDRRTIDAELLFKLAPEIMTTARLSTPWTAIRQFNFNLNHRGNLMDFTTIASGELNGERMNCNVAFKKEGNTIESSATVNTPFEVFPEWAYTFTHSMQRNNIRSTATLTLPCRVYKHFRGEFNTDGTLNNFRSTVKVNTPFESFPEGTMTIVHRGDLQDFGTTGSLEYSGNRIETEMNAKNNNNLQQGVVKITTPYSVLRNLHVVLDNQKQGSDMTGRIEATYNDEKHIDTDYTVNVDAMSSGVINMRAPITMEFRGKDEETKKEMSFNIPRIISLTSNFEKESQSFSQSSRLQVGEGNNQLVSYRLEGSATTRSHQLIYDGRFKVDSSYGHFLSTMSHKINGRRYITDVQVQRLRVNSDIEFQQAEPNIKASMKMSHPSFTNEDILFAIEGSYREAYNGKINLEYADQKFEFVGKLTDESPSGSNTRYVAEAHLTHPASDLDVQFTSKLTNNEEKMGGNMEVKYMMTRDRQHRTNALRAEINKLKEELNMELNTPVKRVSMIGRRVEGKNGQHFTVEGNIDDRDLRADVQLNKEEPGFDINIQVDRENQVFVSGKYSEPSTLQLEAYRETYGRRVRESEVSLSLNSDNIVHARAYLNPNIYDDLQRVLGFDLGLEQMMADVKSAVQEEWQYKTQRLSQAFEPIKQAWNEITAPIARVFKRIYDSDDFYIRTVSEVVHNWAVQITYVDGISQLQYKYRYQIRRAVRNLEIFYYRSTHNIEWFLEEYIVPGSVVVFKKTMEAVEYIRTHPTISRFFDWLESLDMETHYANFRDYCVKLVKQYNAMLDRVNAYWEEFKDIPGMTYVIEYINKLVEGIRWVYDASELDELVKAWMRELRTHGWRAIRMWLQSKMDMVQAEYTHWEPEQGDYEVQVKMPVSWTEVTSIPDFGLSKYWEQLKATVGHIIPDVNFSFGNSWSFWDAFYTYKPSSNPRDWIPPFDTYATVAGSQHFMTFDKKFYQFAGECSYLLVRDFIDGKFSVVINYENNNGITTKKSISIHSGNKEIEILTDFKVMVDGSQTEMPVVLDKTVIRRIGNLIQIDNERGLNVTCDLPHNHCSVHVTGWYYGKTGGLLGTYDNEPATDFQKSDRRHSTSVEEFAKSWSLGRRCSVTNQAIQVNLSSASEYLMCAKYFEEENSPFRLCYAHREPSSFMTMCVNEVSRSNDKEAAVCRIASLYVDQCKMSNVPIRMPRDCVKCSDNNDRPMEEGQTVTLENNDVPKAADVVFVVSHKSCNRDVIARLDDIVNQMTRNFKQSGVRDVHFGLVGYGLSGTLGGPHSHTFEGEIFNTGKKFTAGLPSFAITNEDTTEDSLTALHFAARYPFRIGASKSIVLVPCDSCQEQEIEYPDIQRLLLDRDIHLHLLLHHNFELRTSARKTAYIFGIDREGLFTPRSVGDEELNGDKALRKQVYAPKDLCAALSQESDGSIFSITQLMEARTMVQKKFLDVFTRMTAKKGKPTECQICECMADETGVGISVCRSCTPSEPLNKSWFEYEGSFEEEEDQSSEEIKKRPSPEEKRRRKEARRLRMLNRKNSRKNQ